MKLNAKTDHELEEFLVKGFSKQALKDIITAAQHAKQGMRPQPTIIYHQLSANPYDSLYGTLWMEKIRQSTSMKRTVSINTIVQKIYDNSKEIFKGTKYEHDWYFYHDALSLMTSNSCKKFMTERGIINHWILPQNGLNGNSKYSNRPIGNSPEMMPLDCSLNKDLHEGVGWLCALTSNLSSDDPKKFDKSTPKRARNAYPRAWDPRHEPDGFPSSKRIVEDVEKVIYENLFKIYEARGAVVKGLGTRRGRRNDLGLQSLPRGGKFKKKTHLVKKWVHPDALPLYYEKIKS